MSQQLGTTIMNRTLNTLGRAGKGAPGRLAQSALRAVCLQGDGAAVRLRQSRPHDNRDLCTYKKADEPARTPRDPSIVGARVYGRSRRNRRVSSGEVMVASLFAALSVSAAGSVRPP